MVYLKKKNLIVIFQSHMNADRNKNTTIVVASWRHSNFNNG